MNRLYFVDFNNELSRLTLSEHPNLLFKFAVEDTQHLHDVEVASSESTGDWCKVVSQSSGTQPSDLQPWQKSDATSSQSVRSWAAVLQASSPASTSAERRRHTDEAKLSGSSFVNSPNHSVGLKSVTHTTNLKCRSAAVSDQMQMTLCDGQRNRIKSRERPHEDNCESSSPSWSTVPLHGRKTNSILRTPQQRAGSATQLAEFPVFVDCDKQGKSIESCIRATSSSSNSKSAKQKKKNKKRKAEVPETLNSAEEALVVSREAPEFRDLDEFPSLCSLKSSSKKTPMETSYVHSTFDVHALSAGTVVMLSQFRSLY